MHRATWLPVIIIAAVVVGGLLYLYGGAAFHTSYLHPQVTSPAASHDLTVLAQGDAPDIDARVNYHIETADQLNALWKMLYTDSGKQVPHVDFSRYEVLALFDGSHSTGGYGIQLTDLKDSGGMRTVTITHVEPGDSCVPPGGVTSPFVIVQVPKTSLPLHRVEVTTTTECE